MKTLLLCGLMTFLCATMAWAEQTVYFFTGKIGDEAGRELTSPLTAPMRASIYTEPVSGTAIWARDYAAVTTDARGNFTLVLADDEGTAVAGGPTTPLSEIFAKGTALYLGVRIGGEDAEEVAPRVELVGVPGAIYATSASEAARSDFGVYDLEVGGGVPASGVNAFNVKASKAVLNGDVTVEGNVRVRNAFVGTDGMEVVVPHALPQASVIIMYNMPADGTIPPGWAICDGTNGTPDLRKKFLYGAGSQAVKTGGGEDQAMLTVDNLPAHTHLYKYVEPRSKNGNPNGWRDSGGDAQYWHSTYYWQDMRVDTTTSTTRHNNLPPYKTLVYLMNVQTR